MTSICPVNRRLVADYMTHRLAKENLAWPGRCPIDLRTDRPEECDLAMRALGEEFEERYKQVFSEMCNQLHITSEDAMSTYTVIVDELFADGIKWGRIVALVSFAGCMAVECARKPDLRSLVDDVYDWTVARLNDRLSPWIVENGGWEAFVEFSKCGQKNESPWPSLKTICSYAVGAIGFLTLGAILSQKS